jgi:hypothetical protein
MALALKGVRPATGRVIVLTIVAWLSASTLMNFLGGQPEIGKLIGAVLKATGGLVQPPLLVGPFFFAAIGVVIFGIGRLRGADVGWHLSDLPPAVLVTLGFWAVMQGMLAIWIIRSGQVLRWNDEWSTVRIGPFVGGLLGQLLANALVEELMFRGFLLPQVYLQGAKRLPQWAAVVVALLGSSLLFALSHIPHRLFFLQWPADWLAADQLKLLGFGIAFALVYLVARNLYLCVGIHAIFNQPAALPQAPFWPAPATAWHAPNVSTAWCAAVLMLVVAWPVATRLMQKGGLAAREKRRNS